MALTSKKDKIIYCVRVTDSNPTLRPTRTIIISNVHLSVKLNIPDVWVSQGQPPKSSPGSSGTRGM